MGFELGIPAGSGLGIPRCWGIHSPGLCSAEFPGVGAGNSRGMEHSSSPRAVLRSCRSAALEAQRFWRFVGSALGVAAAAAALVVLRQRVLDRRALEKVRKQIESI